MRTARSERFRRHAWWRLALVVTVATVFSAVVVGAVVPASAYALAFSQRCLVGALKEQRLPSIDGSRVVWQDKRDSMLIGRPFVYTKNIQVGYLDVATGRSHFFFGNDGFSYTNPKVSGNRIVWLNLWPPQFDFAQQGLVAGLGDYKTDKVLPDASELAISGSKVAYSLKDSAGLHLYDAASGSDRALFADLECRNLAISGNSIVYDFDFTNAETGETSSDIGWYDVATGKNVFVCNEAHHQYDPDIDGRYCVWVDERNGNEDIYLADIVAELEYRITSNAGSQRNPAISGNYVVWEDYRNGKGDIYFMDVRDGREVRLTTSSAEQYDPDISGSRVVWTDDRNGDPDIYLGTIGTTVRPKARIGAPKAARTGTRRYTLSGSVVKHRTGSYPVRIQLWKRAGGTWVGKGSVAARAYASLSGSTYKVSYRFSSSGSWRLRAVAPADDEHAASSSGYSYVTVR